MVNVYHNCILHKWVDIEATGRELGVLGLSETVADEDRDRESETWMN